ncbi:MAG: hypothetical protein WA006_04320, partial [Rhodoglobus sp.]
MTNVHRLMCAGMAACLLVLTAVIAQPLKAHAAECSPIAIREGTCNVTGSLGNGNATLEGSTGTPGSSSGG